MTLLLLFGVIGACTSAYDIAKARLLFDRKTPTDQVPSDLSQRESNLSLVLSQAARSGDVQLSSRPQMLVLKWSGGECYVPGQFYSTVENAREQILNSLNTPDSFAMRAYVDAYFEALKAATPSPIQIPQGFGQTISGIPKEQADAVFERIRNLLPKIGQLNPLAIDLDVSSDPHGADFVIEVAQNTKTLRSLNTNDKMRGVWRGLYTAAIKMDGYKSREFPLDLVDDSRGKLVCTLIATNKTGESSCGRADE
jgi:hypothetical protein